MIDDVPCHVCGRRIDPERAETYDVSGPDQYYPEIIYICPGGHA